MENETDTKETGWSLEGYYVSEVNVEDRELSNAIYELNRAIKSPWPEDLMPAVSELLESIKGYRGAVNQALSELASEDNG